jgi:hypothetical protein
VINIILIFLFHWVCDFILQTQEMGVKKSSSIKWLSYHVLVYSLGTTLLWGVFYCGFDLILLTLIFSITFVTHWITDFFTSKWTTKLWKEERVRYFFKVIGLDQLIHATTLLLTYNYLIKII